MNKLHVVFRLNEILTERGMNPRQLSAISGIHYRTALNIFHNETHGISLDVISRICEALTVPPGDLFKMEPENKEDGKV